MASNQTSVATNSLPKQGSTRRQLAPLLIAGLTLLGVTGIVHIAGGRISHLLRDPYEIGTTNPLAGMLSHLGVALWLAAAAFAATGGWRHRERLRRFLLCSALLSVVLGLDDAFSLHERWFPDLLGIPEVVILAAYVLFTAGMVWHFRDVIRARPHTMLVAAVVLFSISVGLDLVEALAPAGAIQPATIDRHTDLYILIEDGAKLLGILAWLLYFRRLTGSSAGIERSRAA